MSGHCYSCGETGGHALNCPAKAEWVGVLCPTPPASQERAGEAVATRRTLAFLKQDERHNTAAESRYWCNQYRLYAEQADQTIATLTAELAEAREQRDSLRDECERLRACATKYLSYIGIVHPEEALEKDMRNPEMVGAALSASGRDADGDGRGK